MTGGIDAREVFAIDSTNGAILGTYHKPSMDCCDWQSRQAGRGRIGIVFLNGRASTRAGHGDAVVYWAEAFAERGYHSFRLDLPGYGDSQADPPDDWLEFINSGGDALTSAAKIGELARRFDLSTLIIMGQCSGAVTAIYMAQAIKECGGLILMEPYFQLPQVTRQKIRQHLSLWALQSRVGSFLRKVFDVLRQIRLFVRSNSLPKNANVPLLRCWKEVATNSLPILILKAHGSKSWGMKVRMGEFDYLKYILKLAGSKGRVSIDLIEGANHTFANRTDRLAVRQYTEKWLQDYFSLIKEEGHVPAGLYSTHGKKELDKSHGKLPIRATLP